MENNLQQKIAGLTDEEVEQCLNGLLNGLMVRNPEYERLLTSPQDMTEVVQVAAEGVGVAPEQIIEAGSQNQHESMRLILIELAGTEEFGPKIEAWIDNERNTLLEPVTTALVLGGIIFALSSSIHFEYENVNGKKKLKVSFSKKPTSESLLKKFFGLFG